jgi:hypothetical protein
MTCARCSELEEEIAYLKAQLGEFSEPEQFHRLRKAGLTRQMADVALLLYRNTGAVQSWRVAEAMWRPDHNKDLRNADSQVKVRVSQIRSVLGMDVIETVFGQAYRMSDAGRAKIASILSPATRPIDPDAADGERNQENIRRSRAAA